MPELVQERTLEGLKIVRIGRGHYLCASRSSPGVSYAVDLEAHEGLGHCECYNFLFRRYPLWKQLGANYDHLRCRHIRGIRNHVLDQIIALNKEKPS